MDPFFVQLTLQLDRRDGSPDAQGAPVILSRGNFVCGGTGDTPLAAFQNALKNGGMEWLEKNIGFSLGIGGVVTPFTGGKH